MLHWSSVIVWLWVSFSSIFLCNILLLLLFPLPLQVTPERLRIPPVTRTSTTRCRIMRDMERKPDKESGLYPSRGGNWFPSICLVIFYFWLLFSFVVWHVNRTYHHHHQFSGYGFADFKYHVHALATLRYLNNNPILSYLAKGGGAPGKKRKKSERDGSISNSPRPRLIVEFTVEEYSKVLRCIPPPPPPPPSVNIYSPVCVCHNIV